MSGLAEAAAAPTDGLNCVQLYLLVSCSLCMLWPCLSVSLSACRPNIVVQLARSPLRIDWKQ